MDVGHRCVMCPRSVLRQRRHILEDSLPQRLPTVAAYISQNGLIEVIFNNIMAVCHRCWQRANNDANRQDVVVDVDNMVAAPEPINNPEDAQPNEIFVIIARNINQSLT